MKSLRIALSIILIAIIVCGCTNPKGPKMYTFGGTWETDGNSITLLSAKTVDSYTTPDGEVCNAAEEKTFILIECKVELAEGWRISIDSHLRHRDYHNYYGLHCDPVPIAGSGEANFLLVVSVFEDTFNGNFEDYEMEIVIQKSENIQRTQKFLLTE